jgi:iron complex outermembrane recepter protein
MKNKLELLSSMIALVVAEQGIAQGTDSGFVLEEVVVTAQKRAENMQDVPLAVSAFSGESLERSGIGDISGLDKRMTGVIVGKGAVTRPFIYIRGIGTRSFDIGSEGSVGVFVDGVYVPRFSSAVQDLLAIERIEVLKGPQGTLYGRNTIGGAINVVTTEPSDEYTGELRARVGNYDTWGVNGSVSGPISDNVGCSLSATYSDSDGPQEEEITGRKERNETKALRGRLKIDATDELIVDVIADYSKTEVDSFVAEFVPNPNAGASKVLVQGPQAANVADVLARSTSDLESQALDVPGFIERESYGLTVKAEWEGELFTFTSITGYQHEELEEARDFDATSLSLIDEEVDQKSDSFSQEIRFSSTPDGAFTFDNNLEWLAGVFYSYDDAERFDTYYFGEDSIISAAATQAPFNFPTFIRTGDPSNVELTTESVALFGQGTYTLTDKLSLTLGLRYSEDTKDFVSEMTTPIPFLPSVIADFTVEDKLRFTSTDPRVTLDYAIDEDILVYATYAEGFKSGGIQYANGDPTLASQSFDPERLTSYEVGIKSRFLEDRVQLNASTFFYEYEDQQILNVINVNGVPTGFTENAGSSELKGLDLEIQAALTPQLTGSLNYSFLESEFTEFDSISGADLTGNELPRTPRNSIKAGLSYVNDLDSLGELVLDLHYAWTDEYYFDESNVDYASQESVGIWDVSATLDLLDDDISVRMFCSNCTDEITFTNFTVFSDGSGGNAKTSYGRRIGLEVKKTF